MLGNAGRGSPQPQGESTAGQQGREREGPSLAGSGGAASYGGGMEKRGFGQDFEVAEKLAELLGGEEGAGVCCEQSQAMKRQSLMGWGECVEPCPHLCPHLCPHPCPHPCPPVPLQCGQVPLASSSTAWGSRRAGPLQNK